MHNFESDLLLLIINLSQLKNKERVLNLFIEGGEALFPDYKFSWHFEANGQHLGLYAVCTREKTYGFIQTDQRIETDEIIFPHFHMLMITFLSLLLEQIFLNMQKLNLC